MDARTALAAVVLGMVSCWPGGAGAATQCSRCEGDLDGDGQVSVAEVIRVVGNVLNGCPRTAQYVANRVVLPQQTSDFALDIDGDGRLDNRFAAVVGALAAQSLDLQGAADQAVANGDLIVLLDETTRDPAFANDASAGSTVSLGTPQPNPDFGGSGQFHVDMTAFPGLFSGPIVAGRFDSAPPATAGKPVQLLLGVPFVGTVVRVPITAAHLRFSRQPDGTLAAAQINGAIRTSDLQATVIPAIAQAFSAVVAADPQGSTSQSLLQIFDTGGSPDAACGTTCRNPDASCAVAGDGVIAQCEVGTNVLIANVLTGDLDLFDTDNHYHPTPQGPDRDSFSIGIGLSAVGAVF